MKKIHLVGGVSTDPVDYESFTQLRAFTHNVLSEQGQIYSTFLDKIVYTIEPGKFSAFDTYNNVEIGDSDVIYIRGPQMRLSSAYAYYMSRFADWHNIDCVNDYSLYYPGTKFAQAIYFLELDIPFLRTVYSVDKDLLVECVADTVDFPAVLKTNVGSHGDANYVIKSVDDMKSLLATEPKADFLLQEFCENDRDYRLLITGKEMLLFERRGDVSTHLNNTSKGGQATKLPIETLPSDIVQHAVSVSQKLKLMISGVDIMPRYGTNEYVFLEVNSQPQLRTGALLDEKKQILQDLFHAIGNK